MPSNMNPSQLPTANSEWERSPKVWNIAVTDKVAKTRITFYSLLALLAIADLTVSSMVLNYSLINSGEFLKSNAEIIVAACVTACCVFANFTVLKNTFVTKLWFELIWLGVCWFMFIGGTGTLHVQTPQLLTYCPTKYFICRGLIAMLVLSSCVIVILSLAFLYILGVCLYQNFRRQRKDIWFCRVVDFEGFDGRMDGRRKRNVGGMNEQIDVKEDPQANKTVSFETSDTAITSTSPTGAPQLTLTTPGSSRDTHSLDFNPFVLELTPPSPNEEKEFSTTGKKETLLDFGGK